MKKITKCNICKERIATRTCNLCGRNVCDLCNIKGICKRCLPSI